MRVVMGMDPGAANFGFGVVGIDGTCMVALDGGVIETTAALPLEQRLNRIHDAIADLLRLHNPEAVAGERVYFGRNVVSAMAVGQATGVAMLAAAHRGISCSFYTPQAIKVAVCGSGDAAKDQVQRMVTVLLGLSDVPDSDHAADALAVAICHAGGRGIRHSLSRAAGSDGGGQKRDGRRG
jgi:crossover junction endodeoxyribonuclease RuvC